MARYKFTWENVKMRYNKVMMACCFEHRTIGTEWTETIDGRDPNTFGIKECLAEAKDRLGWYGPCEARDISAALPEERLYLLNEKKMLERFIAWVEKGLASA